MEYFLDLGCEGIDVVDSESLVRLLPAVDDHIEVLERTTVPASTSVTGPPTGREAHAPALNLAAVSSEALLAEIDGSD